jgi:hypothetical protein
MVAGMLGVYRSLGVVKPAARARAVAQAGAAA